MANLTIPFPEGTRTVVLRGKRITVGRLPENTIQIQDRTISAHHAELVQEGSHYRIRDLDATNGILVDGKQVKDFHLHENCTVNLGNLECKFQREEPADLKDDDRDLQPSRAEVESVRTENGTLKSILSSLRKQVETMQAARAEGAAPLEKLDQLTAERSGLQEKIHELQEELNKVRQNLAVMRRDRDNLQKAYDAKASSPIEPAAAAPAIPVPSAAVSAPSPSAPALPPPAPRLAPVATNGTPVANGHATNGGNGTSGSAPKLPKPPTKLSSAPPPTPAVPSPSTPVRRPASGIVQRAIPAAPELVSTGPRGTEKLVE